MTVCAGQTAPTAPSRPSVQAPAGLSSQQAAAESGLQNPWDVHNILTALLAQTATQLQAKTESLSLGLDLYFRLEALETTTRSLAEGAQKYADRPAADKLSELIAGNFSSRERLRDYLRELTTSTEQNFKIADEEAQSCRAALSKQPVSKKTKK